MITGHVVSARGDYFCYTMYNYQLCLCRSLWRPFAVLYISTVIIIYSNGGSSTGEYAHWSRKCNIYTHILYTYYHIGRYYKFKKNKLNY